MHGHGDSDSDGHARWPTVSVSPMSIAELIGIESLLPLRSISSTTPRMSAPGTPWKSIADSEQHVLTAEPRAEISVRRSPGPAQFIRPTARTQRSSSGALSPRPPRALPAGTRTSSSAPGSCSTYMAHGARARQHYARGFRLQSFSASGELGAARETGARSFAIDLVGQASVSTRSQPVCCCCCFFCCCLSSSEIRIEQKSSYSSPKKKHIIRDGIIKIIITIIIVISFFGLH